MKTVFFDIDSQLDFLFPAGALYVPGAERIVPAIARLNRFAAAHGITVVSTTDAHLEDDPEFSQWPPHCVSGTQGQRKAESTLLEDRVVIPNRDVELQVDRPQIIVEKQTVDVFLCRNLGRLVERLQADRFVVYGVVTEICVLYAARGLFQTGKPIAIVTDAVAGLDPVNSTRALAEVRAAGGTLETAASICCEPLPGGRGSEGLC